MPQGCDSPVEPVQAPPGAVGVNVACRLPDRYRTFPCRGPGTAPTVRARRTIRPDTPGGMTLDVTDLHDQLAERAFLHDDPDAYLAGVRDALDVLIELDTEQPEVARTLRGA
jgi:hypothetical protein